MDDIELAHPLPATPRRVAVACTPSAPLTRTRVRRLYGQLQSAAVRGDSRAVTRLVAAMPSDFRAVLSLLVWCAKVHAWDDRGGHCGDEP